jgi:hypothetical protein
MDSFVSILSLFFPNERPQFLNFVDTITQKSAFKILPAKSFIDILNYHFLTEIYKYTSNTSLNNEKRKNTLVKPRRRGLYFDSPALAKYEALNNVILANAFICKEKVEDILTLFSKAQRSYFAFCKLARLFKIKHAKPSPSSTDLCLNPLSSLNPKLVLNIYDDKSRTMYTFRSSDIINIINQSLSHSPDFFADPQFIKNPFTNVPLSKAQLYNLYFSLLKTSYILPPLFHLFFLSNFHLSSFYIKNECYIREEAINNYFKNMDENTKAFYIRQMLLYHCLDIPNFYINTVVPNKQLLETFSGYIHDYLISLYSMNPEYKIECYTRIKEKLYMFSINNQNYGRNILKKNSYIIPPPSNNTNQLEFNFSNNNNNNNNNRQFIFGSTN